MSEHEQIRDIILNHIGKDNAIKSRHIANEIGIDAGASTVTIRRKIKETMILYKLPIATTSKGYYLMEDDERDLKRYQRSLKKRAIEDIERSVLVTEFFKEYYNRGDLELVGEIIEDLDEDDPDFADDMIL